MQTCSKRQLKRNNIQIETFKRKRVKVRSERIGIKVYFRKYSFNESENILKKFLCTTINKGRGVANKFSFVLCA